MRITLCQRRLEPAGQRRRPHPVDRHRYCHGARPSRADDHPRSLLFGADAELSRNPAGDDDPRARSQRPSPASIPMPCISPPKDRSAGWRAAGAWRMACRSPHRSTRGFPDYVAARTGPVAASVLAGARTLSPRRAAICWSQRRGWRPNLPNMACTRTRPLDARRRPEAVQPRPRAASGLRRSAAPDRAACRPGGGGKEYRGVSRRRLAGVEGRRWRWPGARRPDGALPAGAFPRRAARRGAGLDLCRRRCAGLPQPHRHLRAGHHRGAGLRNAGGRLSRCRGRSTFWGRCAGHRRRGAACGSAASMPIWRLAMRQALAARRSDCAAYGARFSWERSCDQFLAALCEVDMPLTGLAA